MSEELKPCPFCGGEAYLETRIEDVGNRIYHTGCATPSCDMCPRMTFYSKEAAIAAWNRRAEGWRDAKTDLPDDYEAVNVVWVNRDPPSYYAHEKDVPHVGTAHYMDEVRGWYWESPICYDMLTEYGDSITDRVADGIDIICWMPLPKLPEVKL